ncbi:hypothetical protein NL676_020690 [Syzygium grande]|nr:hypothetical protein NL676_020690 [Syzygium grande]
MAVQADSAASRASPAANRRGLGQRNHKRGKPRDGEKRGGEGFAAEVAVASGGEAEAGRACDQPAAKRVRPSAMKYAEMNRERGGERPSVSVGGRKGKLGWRHKGCATVVGAGEDKPAPVGQQEEAAQQRLLEMRFGSQRDVPDAGPRPKPNT